jgi:hypothetical protein
MYLHYIVPEIESGTYQQLPASQLPKGLAAYYDDHWERMGMRSDPPPLDKLRIVYAMAQAKSAVSRQLITSLFRQNPVFVQRVIDDWLQFLHEQTVAGEPRYSLYHTSFREFLHDKEQVKAAGELIAEVTAAYSETIWRVLMEGERSR